MTPFTDTDVLILGAGAAGLMCAIEAGRRGRRTLVLDHADSPGKKVLISGGGRCNFTNLRTAPENFLSTNPHFGKSALARYNPQDFLALVQKHRIPYHEKTLGQLFCDRSAHDILTMLLRECAEANARIQLSTRILSVAQIAPSTRTARSAFRVETTTGPIATQSLVIATGGLSIPKMGATGFGYDLARQFGLEIVEPRPGLVPLVFSPEDATNWCDLSGLSTEVIASTDKLSFRPEPLSEPKASRAGRSGETRDSSLRKSPRPAFREKLLVTHRGLSGPAILQVSSYWQPGQPIEIDLAPDREITAPLLAPGAPRDHAALSLRTALPRRLADRWLRLHPPETKAANPRPAPANAALAEFERNLHAWRVIPAGTEGYAKAEVTAGGVSTAELDSSTMQSRRIPGLYFIGEVVDVTGWLGGYNFQWAWASGFAAGQFV